MLGCAWPLALHAAVTSGHGALSSGITAAFAVVALALWAAAARRSRVVAASIAAIVGVIALHAAAPLVLLYAPSIVIPALAAAAFAGTLRSGSEPAISRIARLERGPLPPDLVRYTRRLTVIWAALLAAIAIVALGLALFAGVAVWSLFANIIGYLVIGALFVGEYAYRRRRFPQYEHASLSTLARNVRSGGIFKSR